MNFDSGQIGLGLKGAFFRAMVGSHLIDGVCYGFFISLAHSIARSLDDFPSVGPYCPCKGRRRWQVQEGGVQVDVIEGCG